jgi:hypothetical protein
MVAWWEGAAEIGTSGPNVGLVSCLVELALAVAYELVEVLCDGPFVVAWSPLGRWQHGGKELVGPPGAGSLRITGAGIFGPLTVWPCLHVASSQLEELLVPVVAVVVVLEL